MGPASKTGRACKHESTWWRKKLANIDEAYRETLEENHQLRLTIQGLDTDVPKEKLDEALRALYEKFDRSKADAMLAEVEEMEQGSVERAARAAFARGEIAEAEVRWDDAFEHYDRAARLNPTFDTLYKAREFAWRAGYYPATLRWGEDLLAWAHRNGTQEQLAAALNEHAVMFQSQGRYVRAEGLFRQALEIDKTTIGEDHPDYAIRLYNLASVVQAQGRYEEAEGIYRQSAEIEKLVLGEAHPDYAITLTSLAGVFQVLGRNEEVERLYQEALKIFEDRLGSDHLYTKGTKKKLDTLLASRPED